MSVRGVLGCGNECVIIFVGGSAFLSSSLEDNSKLILNVAFGASEFRRKSFVRGTLFRINLADWVTCLKNSSSEESILESFWCKRTKVLEFLSFELQRRNPANKCGCTLTLASVSAGFQIFSAAPGKFGTLRQSSAFYAISLKAWWIRNCASGCMRTNLSPVLLCTKYFVRVSYYSNSQFDFEHLLTFAKTFKENFELRNFKIQNHLFWKNHLNF